MEDTEILSTIYSIYNDSYKLSNFLVSINDTKLRYIDYFKLFDYEQNLIDNELTVKFKIGYYR